MKDGLRVTPTRFATIKRRIAEDPATRLLGVECFIAHVNAVMADAERRAQCRSDPTTGSFWQVRLSPLALNAAGVLHLQQAFEKAGWPQVQVVYWRDSCSVSLGEHRHHNFGGAMFNGRPAEDVTRLEGIERAHRDSRTLPLASAA